ncbi:MAG: glycosyltransferase [Candidatus Dormibacteria bacterium]
MRIGLDLRVLSVGRQNVVRGIPRFTQEQLQSVLSLDRDNTYLLLCDPGDDIGAIRPEIRAAPNAHVVCAPEASPRAFTASDDTRTLLARYSAYQRWIEGLHLDLYHSTCHFWVSRLILPGFDACPYVVTAYDLIPLLYPAQVSGEALEAYQRGLLFLEQATRVAAISEATAGALVEHVGVPRDRIDLTLPAVSPCFRQLPGDITRSILASLQHPSRRSSRRRVRIPTDYILSVTDLHYTKNLYTLLAGYAQLPAATRSRFPLVIAGQQAPGHVELVYQRARALDIERDVILTGRASDHELVGLYNGATIVVNPSHHEGFGLTVAEAMRCGTPVITTTRSALPEVTADAALLVDSEDASAFAVAMATLLRDSGLRDELRSRGLVQAARYTVDALGHATLDLYQRALSPASRSAGQIRVALWSSVAPQAGTAAATAGDVISGLSSTPGVQLDVFVDDGVMPSLDVMRTARAHHWSDFDRCTRKAPYDAVIYELDTSPFQPRVASAVLEAPGIVVLRDAEAADAKLVDAATCCLMFDPDAATRLQRRHPNADVRVIPGGVCDPRRDGLGFDRFTARGYLDLLPRDFVIVAPSPPESAAEISTLVAALADLRRAGSDAVLAVVGPAPEVTVSALRSRAARLGIADAVRVTGPVSPLVFDAYLTACDVVVVLGGAKETTTPAALLRACAAGCCVLVSDSPGWVALPDSAYVRLQTPHDRAGVGAALAALAADPQRRHDLERAARAHYEATATLDRMVDGYMHAIRDKAARGPVFPVPAVANGRHPGRGGRPAPRGGPLPYSKTCELEDFAHTDLRDVVAEVAPHKRAVFGAGFPSGFEHRDDWEAAMAVRTLADHGLLREDARVLGVSERIQDSFLYLTRHVGEVVALHRAAPPDATVAFAFRPERLTARRMGGRAIRYPDESFDAIVLRLSVDGSRDDLYAAAETLFEIGRVLKPGGVVSCSADILIASDPGSDGATPPVGVLTGGEIERYIVEASGLEAIGDMPASVSHWTASTARELEAATTVCGARMAAQREGARPPQWSCWEPPHVVLRLRGRCYTSVHLALRRASLHPVSDNGWARRLTLQ